MAPVARGEGTRGFYSLRYLSSVAVATLALAMVAWIVQDRQLALAAGVMGLYALHLISIRYILDNQQQHTQALQSQWELLQRLVDPDEPADQAVRKTADGVHNGADLLPDDRPETLEIPDRGLRSDFPCPRSTQHRTWRSRQAWICRIFRQREFLLPN